MRRVCLAFLVILLLTTACAGERPSLEDSAAREVDAIAAASESSSTTAPVDGRPSLRLAVPEGWSLDPADAGPASLTNRVLAGLLYEGITAIGPDGGAEPGLADRWFVSDDRLTWTFVFPEGLADADDEPITARNVKSSLERIAARGGADHAATALTMITGWSDQMDGTARGVAGISAPDELTLVIRLDSPFELLLDVLASPAFGITGEQFEGGLRLTGAFASTDEADRFVSRDAGNPVREIVLVADPDGSAAAFAAGEVDWAVLSPADSSADLDGDIVRQPLDIELAMVARSPTREARLGALNALEPLLLAGAVEGLTARTTPSSATEGEAPAAVLLDLPSGSLDALADALVSQLEAAGVQVVAAAAEPDAFANRVASGDALLFPIVIAGGTGPASAALRLGVPGASDDVFGPESEARAELAQAVTTELDTDQRDLFVAALEQALIDDGLLLPIGRYEVRVAIGPRLEGLRHRDDGTLDLTAVRTAAE